eukprot:18804-Heterococcus_DN1.PRE.2
MRKEWLIHHNDLSSTPPSHHSLILLTIMNARAQKRSAADDSRNPLLQADILQRVLDYVGPGHWYFISTVSSLWKDAYERVKPATSKCSKEDPGIKMTLISAIFASPSRLKLVHSSCPYCLMNIQQLEDLVGWYADKATLMAALALTLVRNNSDILTGAVRSGDLSKVIWLYTEQHCELGDHNDVISEAIRGGSVAVVDWLRLRGVFLQPYDCSTAAYYGHMHVLQYLHAQGCGLDPEVCFSAAVRGDLAILKWAYEHGCSLLDCEEGDIRTVAAESHNVELMAWLIQQPGIELEEEVMFAAARGGNSAMCEFLHAHDCPWDASCCEAAATVGINEHGNLELLRWFREHGCPWDTDELAEIVAL